MESEDQMKFSLVFKCSLNRKGKNGKQRFFSSDNCCVENLNRNIFIMYLGSQD